MFDLGVIEVIMAGFGGLTVVGLTEMVKRAVGAKGFWSYLISLVISAAFTAYYLVTAGQFSFLPFVVYTLLVFLTANGIFKTVVKAPQGR